jgi:ethanolamine utilization protein EutQ (cupin superfamily)
MSKNIKLVKLVSGEEVVCNVVNNGDLTIEIDECILVGFQQNPETGKMGIAVMPWAPSAKFPVQLDKDKVMFVAEASEGALAAHGQAFARIMTVPQGLTLPRK